MVNNIFGIPLPCKCRFCDNEPTIYKVGSIEVIDHKVVSVRVFYLCDEHKDNERFEMPFETN